MIGGEALSLLCLFLLIRSAFSLSLQQRRVPTESPSVADDRRRNFLLQSIAATGVSLGSPLPALADSSDDREVVEEEIEVYFGCGCFWHVQHEFVQAERKFLRRHESQQLTARAGYAGGNTPSTSKACYHNAAQISDYGTLGHAEVVQVRIPPSALADFCTVYSDLFTEQGYRPDQFQDRGAEYRNLVGLPGGVDGPYAKQLVQTSIQAGDKLDFARGKGNDPDRRSLVFVMDTEQHPFRVAEQYHQFHDGFNIGENYPSSYNNLAKELAAQGLLGKSDCPNGLLGIGAFGL